MTNFVYSTACTPWFIAAQQAVPAGGAPVNLLGGAVMVGDGNGGVPTISQLIANGGVLRQVWQGLPSGITQDASNTGQIDVSIVIPTVDANGNEIGPFNITEFAIYDATGNLAIVGTTNLQKTTSAQGQLMTLQWYACYIAAAANAVTVQPPPGSYPTLGQIQSGVAGLLSANSPLSVTATLQSSGWTKWLLNIASAGLSALGVGRPATDSEFVAGAPGAGAYSFPWVQIEQVWSALSHYLPLAGGTMTGPLKAPVGFQTRIDEYASATTITAAQSGGFLVFGGLNTYNVTLPVVTSGLRYSGYTNNPMGFTLVAQGAPLIFEGVVAPSSIYIPFGSYFDFWSDGGNWIGQITGPGIYLPIAGGTMTGALKAPQGLSTVMNYFSSAATLTPAMSGSFLEFNNASPMTVTLPSGVASANVRYTGLTLSAGVTLSFPGMSSLLNSSSAGPGGTFYLPPNTYFDIWSNGLAWYGFACGAAIYPTTGRLLNIQKFTTSGIYTPTAGTAMVMLEGCGAGGGGGGVSATDGSHSAAGGGGAGGDYGKAMFTSGFSGIPVVIGAGGAAGVGAADGGAGGTTSFGSLLVLPGGLGGQQGVWVPTSSTYATSGVGALSSGAVAGANILSIAGQEAWDGQTWGAIALSGAGGDSFFGSGGGNAGSPGSGHLGTGFGAGGSGAANGPSGAVQNGARGCDGLMLIYEYSA